MTDFRRLFVGRKSRTMSTLSLLASFGVGWHRNWKPSFMCLRSRVLYTVLSHSSWIYVVELFLCRWQTRTWKRREDVPKSASSHACVQRWFKTVMSVFPKDFSWDDFSVIDQLVTNYRSPQAINKVYIACVERLVESCYVTKRLAACRLCCLTEPKSVG